MKRKCAGISTPPGKEFCRGGNDNQELANGFRNNLTLPAGDGGQELTPAANTKNMKNIKERILATETVHGSWVNLGSTVAAEITGNAGFDWVLIDLEHGAGNIAVMYQQLQALESTTATERPP